VGVSRKEGRGRPSAPRLFPIGSLELHATGQARLRSMAKTRVVAGSARERLAREDRETMRKLQHWGQELCAIFDLRYTALEAEREGVTDWYGVCYEDGVIRIRLRNATNGRLLKESSLVDTLCHELAHLRHLNHGAGFRRLYEKILAKARECGIYRPGPDGGQRPRQGLLFGADGCGTRR